MSTSYYTELVFLYAMGSMGHVVHSGACRAQNLDVLFFMLGWACSDSMKSALGQVTLNLFFASGGINVSRSAFWCILGAKHHVLFFMLGWDRYGFDKKRTGACYAELLVLHPEGSAGHVVHPGA
jgi:hypothetical protein